MCIIIDTNVLGAVFNKHNAQHSDFEPVLDWIFNGQGKIVYGGTKYFSEITKYLKLFQLLKSINKAVYINNILVDEQTENVSDTIVHRDFDDQHLVGLLMASGCRLICTNDTTAIPFIQNRAFFKSAKEPKIYHTKRNVNLLNPKYIALCCGQCRPSTNEQRDIMNGLLGH
jgi:predicted nucleic acid-binding protein